LSGSLSGPPLAFIVNETPERFGDHNREDWNDGSRADAPARLRVSLPAGGELFPHPTTPRSVLRSDTRRSIRIPRDLPWKGPGAFTAGVVRHPVSPAP
jgi:hypothetical protein